MKLKTTYEKLFNFAAAARAWVQQDATREKTKLGYAIYRMGERVQQAQNRYTKLVEDINIDCCSTDDKGIILRDARGEYQFTKQGLKDRNAKRQELFESEVEIEVYFASEVPPDLTDIERDLFAGFVIKEDAAAAAAITET